MSDDVIDRFVAGSSFTLTLTPKDETGAIIDITGADIEWQLKKRHNAPALITKSTGGSGISILNPGENNTFRITCDPADSSGLQGRYVHDSKVTVSSGQVYYLRSSADDPDAPVLYFYPAIVS